MSAEREPIVEWAEPPPKGQATGPKSDWVPVTAGYLRAHPNRWALVRTMPGRGPGLILRTFRRYGCEATTRNNDNGTFSIYARYVGVVDEITDRRRKREQTA